MKANKTKRKARTGTLFIYDIIAILIAVCANLAISRFNGAALSRDLLIIVLFMTGIRLIVMAFADLLGLAKKFWQGTLFAVLAEIIVVAVEYLMSFGLTPRFLLLTAVTAIVLVTVSHIIWAHRNKKALAEDAADKDKAEEAEADEPDDATETPDEQSGDDQKVNWMLRGSVFEDETTADISEAIAQARAEAEAAEADEQDGDVTEADTDENTETDEGPDEIQESADDETGTSEDVEAEDDDTDDVEDEAAEPSDDEAWDDEVADSVDDEDDGPAFDGLSPVDAPEAPTDIQDDAEEAPALESDAENAEANETEDSETPEEAEDDTSGFAGMTGMFEPVRPEDMAAESAEEPKKPAIKARPAREDFSEIERTLGRFIDDISDSASGDDATFANDTEALRNALSDLNAITSDKTVVRCGRKLRKELTFVTKRRHLDDAIIDDLVDLTQMISQHVAKQQPQDQPKTAAAAEPAEAASTAQPAQPKQAPQQQTTVTVNRVPSHKSPVKLADGEIILDSGDSEIIIDAETLEMIKQYTKAHAND